MPHIGPVRSPRVRQLLSAAAVAALTACGGGGGGGSALPSGNPNPTPTPTPTPGAGVTVSGIASAAEYAQIDSDTNDVKTSPVRNNSLQTAQALPSQFRLGGYVNLAGAGPSGLLRSGGDADDIYRASLSAGQFVNLYIGDTNNGDLDLYLLDANGDVVDASLGPAAQNVESVEVPFSGTFFIAVNAFDDPNIPNSLDSHGTYALAPGSTAAAQHALRVSADLIPGQVMVQRHESASPAKSGATASAKAAALGMEWLGGDDSLMLLGFDSAQQKANARAAMGLDTPRAKAASSVLQEKLETLQLVKAVARQPGVRLAEPPLRRKILRVPNDPGFATQWHYPQINLPQAWDVTIGSPDVLVAVIDTGVLVNHPDLRANLDSRDPDGFDFIANTNTSNDGNGRDGNADDAGDESDPDGGASFHGTHCAGTIAAVGNNGTGVTGVSWNSQIMPLRALGVGGGSSFDVLEAMKYAAGLSNASGQVPAKRADILSMSLGGSDSSQIEQDVVTQVRNAGVIIIAAAGNSGSSSLEFPASYAGVVSVAATNIQRGRAFYSQFNSAVDVAAPGGDVSTDLNGDGVPDGVLSTFGNGAPGRSDFAFSFRTQMGTSMATPHMAGVVALMKAVHPGLTPAQLDTALAAGQLTDDLGPAGRDNSFGHGLINAAKAVAVAQQLAAGSAPPPPAAAPVLVANPGSVNFGNSRNTMDLSLANGGQGSLTVTSVSENEPWLTITADALAADHSGTRRLTVNRAGLAPGLYSTNITAVSSANTLTIPVSMEVAAAGAAVTPTAGFLFFLLVDAATGEAVADAESAPVNGQYSFSFSGVPAGRYFIVAGTDSDNNNFICEDGEACGFFPTDIDGDFVVGSSAVSGISFPVSFEVGVSTSSAGAGASRKGYRRD